ncbi:MAG: hypothetical protein NTZ80_01060 [Patescibacteria group bacterium]|nr:hypothetical protein [Patescibacteria group bacterium]
MPVCIKCQSQFEITPEDLLFYDKISPVFNDKRFQIPAPRLCPDCRLQIRLSFRHGGSLHSRLCDLSGKKMISMYPADTAFKVYESSEWWSDKWDGLNYGRGFDANRPFAEQFQDLYNSVPHVALVNTNAENSYYNSHTINSKNCYLIFGGTNNEDAMYGHFIISCKNVFDGMSINSCELCYEGISSIDCYDCKYFYSCRNCDDCLLVEDCQSCHSCIGCFGLRSKEYHVFNKPVSKDEYKKIKEFYASLNQQKLIDLKKKLNEIKSVEPHIYAHIYNSEECTGDMIFNCRNCLNSFDCRDCEDCKNLSFTPKSKESYDCTFNAPDGCQFTCDAVSTTGTHSAFVTSTIWYGNDVYYSIECHYSNHIFGCTGLRNQEYCILNKKYNKADYEKTVAQIIEQMQKTGEWGYFFPPKASPFAYNESLARYYFPSAEEQSLSYGWKWHSIDQSIPRVEKIIPADKLGVLADINKVPDDILKWAIECAETKRPFMIQPAELKFYRNMGLPIPLFHPEVRHQKRILSHNPRHLWIRQCNKCGIDMQTSYSPDRPETVYCEKCYLEAVY